MRAPLALELPARVAIWVDQRGVRDVVDRVPVGEPSDRHLARGVHGQGAGGFLATAGKGRDVLPPDEGLRAVELVHARSRLITRIARHDVAANASGDVDGPR